MSFMEMLCLVKNLKKPKLEYESCGQRLLDDGEDCGECDEGLYCDAQITPSTGMCGMCKKKRGKVMKKGK